MISSDIFLTLRSSSISEMTILETAPTTQELPERIAKLTADVSTQNLSLYTPACICQADLPFVVLHE
jgi:hypothetical protein